MNRFYNPSLGLLLLRLVVGIIFIAHGSQKLFGAFGGGGPSGTAGFFASAGIPAPGVMAWVVGLAEFLGGLSVLFGLLTPVGGALIAAVMVVAILVVHLKNGFFAPMGIEFPLVNLAAVLALIAAGPGRYSVDGRREAPTTNAR
jgi:putative oxidoreductase